VIHHKFVVCDFNGGSPVVFCGSSNLAAGGGTSNGDNLIAIYDQKIATIFAVEAIRLFDHYRFGSLREHSTSNAPLMLNSTDAWRSPTMIPRTSNSMNAWSSQTHKPLNCSTTVSGSYPTGPTRKLWCVAILIVDNSL